MAAPGTVDRTGTGGGDNERLTGGGGNGRDGGLFCISCSKSLLISSIAFRINSRRFAQSTASVCETTGDK